jgi:hypothetical protein
MENKWILLIGAVFGIQLAGVEGGIEAARIGICITIYRSAGTIQGLLHVIDRDQKLFFPLSP